MKKALLVFLMLVSSAFAAPPPTEKMVRRTQSLYTEVIPRLQFKDATFEEALKMMWDEWEKRHPGDSFPVATTKIERVKNPPAPGSSVEPADAASVPRYTVDLHNIPFIEALRYLASLTSRELRFHDGIFELRELTEINEGWTGDLLELTPTAVAALKVTPDSENKTLQQAFEPFGVKFEPWMRLRLVDTHRPDGVCGLTVLSYREQLEQIAGIVSLLNHGFKITK